MQKSTPAVSLLKNWQFAAFLFLALSLASCSKKTSGNAGSGYSKTETGKASYYADKFNGRKTANGEIYNSGKLTAAHRSIPFGTIVTVTNLSNGKSVKVRINDRGPWSGGRIIDLSRRAAEEIDMVRDGVVSVKIGY
jgi:rare lipoprotein A